jgi:hypothetical protein
MNRRELHREAHRLVELGYRLVPIRYGGKTPLVRWKDLESGHRAVDRWMGRFGAMNLAVHTGSSGIVGLDADTDRAAEWIAGNCPETPMVCRTPRGGIHAYFRAPEDPPPPAVNLFGIGLDVRSRRSILVVSPSWSAEHRRSWEWRDGVVRAGELPLLPDGPLRRVPRAEKSRRPVAGCRGCAGIRDVARWIMRVESVQGQNGSGQCFKVACRLVDAGLDWDRAWQTLLIWNDRMAEPPWSEKELRHKLEGAFRRFR